MTEGRGNIEGKENAASERTADLDPIRLEGVDLSLLKGPRFCYGIDFRLGADPS